MVNKNKRSIFETKLVDHSAGVYQLIIKNTINNKIMSINASSLIGKYSPEDFTFQSVSRNKIIEEPSTSLLDWMGQIENITVEDQGYCADTEKALKKVHFSLTGKLAGFFPLLRGIAGSGKPSSLFLDANPKEKFFILYFDTSLENEAKNYLSSVFNILEKESRFKQILRKVISNQEIFMREEKLLFNELSN